MPFSKISTGNPDLDRVQQAVSAAFDEVNSTDDHAANVVDVSANYKVRGSEDVVGVTSGSPTITLLPPKQATKKLIVVNSGSGVVNVATPNNSFTATVAAGSSRSFVPNGAATTYLAF